MAKRGETKEQPKEQKIPIKAQPTKDQLWNQLRSTIDHDFATLKEERAKLEEDKKEFELMKAKIASIHFSSTIKLDVGGHRFKTSLMTLTKEDSMLARMFSGKGFLVEKDEDGYYFIDRPGRLFEPILTYLQTGEFIFPQNPPEAAALRKEVDFYQIYSLIDKWRQHKEFSQLNDTNGVIYWLATQRGSAEYKNPKSSGFVEVSGGNNPTLMVSHPSQQTGDGGSCNSFMNQYIDITLKNVTVIPSSYSLSHGNNCHRPYNWKLEGFNNGNWILLRQHQNDNSLNSNNRHNWKIDNCSIPLSQFRLTCTGYDTTGSCCCFHVGQFEIYGTAIET